MRSTGSGLPCMGKHRRDLSGSHRASIEIDSQQHAAPSRVGQRPEYSLIRVSPDLGSNLRHQQYSVMGYVMDNSQDRANKIVILTGAGGEFITAVEWSSFGDVSDPGVWSQIHDEGIQALENIANIRVPVIAAIEGRAHIHSDYALLANVIVAAEGATFQDTGHYAAGGCAGGRNLYDVELSCWSRTSGGLPAQPTAAAGAHRTRMGSCCRDSA
jgi:hypothetical protein